MIKYQINDNELLYLIYEMNDYAFELLCLKYSPMIKRRVKDSRVSPRHFDDFYQEGIITLGVAVKRYKTTMSKSFNKFFDLLLQRRFINLKKHINKFDFNVVLIDDSEYLSLCEEEEQIKDINIDTSVLSGLEKETFTLIYLMNYKVKDVSSKLKVDARSVYNALARARLKMKKINDQTKTIKP